MKKCAPSCIINKLKPASKKSFSYQIFRVMSNSLLFIVCAFSFVSQLVAQTVNTNEQQKLDALRAHYEAAQKFERVNDWAAAETEWREALKIAPTDGRTWVNLGIALTRQNKTNDAVDAYTRAAALEPTLAGAHLNLGLLYVKNTDFASAVAPLRRALTLDPQNESARRALVVALIGIENFQAASREIAVLLAHAPRDAALLELAADMLIRQHRYSEAVAVLKRRLELESATGKLWAEYGDALDGAKRTPEALAAYERAVALAPDDSNTRYGLGYLYWKLYRYPEAERELKEVLRRNAKDARAAFTLGDLYLTRGTKDDAAKALPLLEQALKSYPNEFDTHFALGRALLILDETPRAIEHLRAAVKLDDSIADGHFRLGRALTQNGQRDEGQRELARARELNNAKQDAERARFLRKEN